MDLSQQRAMNVIIVGGGIGGLTTALSLHAAGIACRVYEGNPEIQPLGVGINVLPHSVRELTELGLQVRLDDTGIRTQELVYATKRGEVVWREPRGLGAGYHWPQYSIHRGHLQMLLLEAVKERLGAQAVQCDHAAVAVTQEGGRATVQFRRKSDGTALPAQSADLVIACDGIHSALRAQFYPDEGPPVWSKRILWRGTTIGKPFLTGASMVVAGYAWKKWVCYPIRQLEDGLQLINWIAELTFEHNSLTTPQDWNRLGKLDDFMPDFEQWDFGWMHVANLIRQAQSIYEFPMCDRNPVPTWTFGRVVLLGDAAHPMYPIGSNGASQAILDARKIAYELATQPTVETALRAYEADRLPTTAKVVELNRGEGPDAVLQRVEERAPNGFADLEAIMPLAEREAIAGRYKVAAGFDRDTLNNRASLGVLPRRAAHPAT
jgi:5-methylphenazine-1-carboxylate 1-monooxygenase